MADHDVMIDIEVGVNKKVDVSIHVSDVIYALNSLELPQKWNQIAKLLNCIELDTDGLNDDHKKIILDWLDKQTKKFKH